MEITKEQTNLFYDEISDCIIDKWSEANENESAKIQLEESIEFAKELSGSEDCYKWLVDLSDLKPGKNNSDGWVYIDLIPRLINSGYTSIAIVKDDYDCLNDRELIDVIKIGQFKIGQFRNFEKGKNWLIGQ
ncbi:hypothetical protein [Flexithrix dorotheae]|uniref:hypothetical protein n=1 Tax=Flexithrix dorotheae TaxID=70993 RepID=UPI0003698579|nr:hypothetical protein [Flexithrix dorotheae]